MLGLWVPNGRQALHELTPDQRRLQQRLALVQSIGVLVASATIFAVGLAGIWGGWFYAPVAIGGVITAVVIVRSISFMRALRRTGPPFEKHRWWWPRRSQLGRGRTAAK
jgi:hypothetical protein